MLPAVCLYMFVNVNVEHIYVYQSVVKGRNEHFYLMFFLTILSTSNQDEQLWVWQYETEDGTHELFMDIGEDIR